MNPECSPYHVLLSTAHGVSWEDDQVEATDAQDALARSLRNLHAEHANAGPIVNVYVRRLPRQGAVGGW